jgi:hypothetical protein
MRNFKSALVISGFVLVTTWFVAWLLFTFLPVSSERFSLSLGCVFTGGVLACGTFWLMTILPEKRSVQAAAFSLALFVLLAPLISSWIGRVSYSRFGFTTYGLVPIPTLDITINQHGKLWFRPKTHLILRDEIANLLEPDTEVVIVGIGWDRIARVETDALPHDSQVELIVLSTPEAFRLFNTMKSQGRRVVLVAHSTC